MTACPAGSLPLSTRMTAALCGSLSLWIRLLCLTDQFPSCWAGRTSFHPSHSNEVGACSKPPKGTLILRKINHPLSGEWGISWNEGSLLRKSNTGVALGNSAAAGTYGLPLEFCHSCVSLPSLDFQFANSWRRES